MKPPLLAVDSDIAFSTRAQGAWNNRKIATIRVDTMDDAIRLLQAAHFMLVVINADSVDYLSQLPVMRASSPAPIFVGTSYFKVEDQIAANNSGAHFYIQFRKNPEENVESVLAMYRGLTGFNMPQNDLPGIVSINDMHINTDNREVLCSNTLIPLTKKEFEILHYLVANRNRILTYQMIYSKVWGDAFENSPNSVVQQHVYNMRNKFDNAIGHDGYIENITGVGYRIWTKKTALVKKQILETLI